MLARDHRLAEEHPPERHAVEPADQLVAAPHLDRVRQPFGRASPGRPPACPGRARCRLPRHEAPRRRRRASTKASSRLTRTSRRFSRRREVRETWNSAQRSTIRGFGDHQRIGSPSLNQGKMPCDRRGPASPPTDRRQRPASRRACAAPASAGGNLAPGARNGIMLKCSVSLPDGECSSEVELRIVDPAVAGSIPVTHPTFTSFFASSRVPLRFARDRCRSWVGPLSRRSAWPTGCRRHPSERAGRKA